MGRFADTVAEMILRRGFSRHELAERVNELTAVLPAHWHRYLEYMRPLNEAARKSPALAWHLIEKIREDKSLAEEFKGMVSPIVSVRALDEMKLPRITWVIEGIMPEGFVLLGGREKGGKTCLLCQWSDDIIAGNPIFGRRVTTGPVLYLACQDTDVQFQERRRKQGFTSTPENFHVATIHRVQQYYLGPWEDRIWQLERQIQREGYRLVVIDVLPAFICESFDHSNYGEAHPIYCALAQAVKSTSGCALVGIEHHTKSTLSEVVRRMQGSVAKAANADTLIGIGQDTGSIQIKLVSIGRFVNDSLYMRFNMSNYRWYPIDVDEEKFYEDDKIIVLDYIERHEGQVPYVDMLKELGWHPQKLARTIKRLTKEGHIHKDGKSWTLGPKNSSQTQAPLPRSDST